MDPSRFETTINFHSFILLSCLVSCIRWAIINAGGQRQCDNCWPHYYIDTLLSSDAVFVLIHTLSLVIVLAQNNNIYCPPVLTARTVFISPQPTQAITAQPTPAIAVALALGKQ